MKTSRLFYALILTIALVHAAAATAAGIDMDDPRRVVGREDNVRIDAQLIQDTVSPGSAIGVTYQIQNLSNAPVAVADKVTSASYDADTQTITLAIGAEVPEDGRMPHLVTIAPGETKTFRTGATPMLNTAAIRSSLANAPRLVQVKVSILRDIAPYAALMSAQQPKGGVLLSDEQFDHWFEANDTIILNAVPVRFSPRGNPGGAIDAGRRDVSSRGTI